MVDADFCTIVIPPALHERIVDLALARGMHIYPRSRSPTPWRPPSASLRKGERPAFNTSAFKSVGTLQNRIDELERQPEHVQREYSIVGRSPSIQQIKQRIEKLAASALPVLITGEAGTGKKLLARGIHEAARRSCSELISSEDTSRESLFGFAPSEGGRKVLGLLQYHSKATPLIENVECLCVDAQERLIEVIETGNYRRLGDNERGRFVGRLILTSTRPLSELGSSGLLMPLLESRLAPRSRLSSQSAGSPRRPSIPLRTLPTSAPKGSTPPEAIGGPLGLPSADDLWLARKHPRVQIRARNGRHPLRRRLDQGRALPPLGDVNAEAPRPGDEREWILDALQRHRFRRGEAARYLVISRKTLYNNKMRAYGLPLQQRERS